MLGFRKKDKQNDDDFIVELYKLYSAVVKKTVYAKLYSKSIEGELDLSSGAVKSRIMRLKRHIETEVKSFTG